MILKLPNVPLLPSISTGPRRFRKTEPQMTQMTQIGRTVLKGGRSSTTGSGVAGTTEPTAHLAKVIAIHYLRNLCNLRMSFGCGRRLRFAKKGVPRQTHDKNRASLVQPYGIRESVRTQRIASRRLFQTIPAAPTLSVQTGSGCRLLWIPA